MVDAGDQLPPEVNPPSPQRRGRRLQFGVWIWFVVTFLFSVALAPVAGMLGTMSAEPAPPEPVYLVLLLATPLAVLVVLSLTVSLLRAKKNFRKKGE